MKKKKKCPELCSWGEENWRNKTDKNFFFLNNQYKLKILKQIMKDDNEKCQV